MRESWEQSWLAVASRRCPRRLLANKHGVRAGEIRACARPCDCASVPASHQISTQDTPSSIYRVARLMARLNEAPVPTESVDACMSYCISTSLSTTLSTTLTRPSKAPLRATKPRTRQVCAFDTIYFESLRLTSFSQEQLGPMFAHPRPRVRSVTPARRESRPS